MSMTTKEAAADSLGVFDQAAQLRRLAERSRRPVRREIKQPTVAAEAPRRRAKVIAVTSGKGGVGKTNIGVNLAIRFAQAGRRTLLLDADLGTANADVVCGLDVPRHLGHFIARTATLPQVTLDAPGGFKLIGGANGLARVADLGEVERQRIVTSLAALENECDVLIIDTGAGISPNVLSFTRAADQVLVVTTPEPTAITDAYAVTKVITRSRPAGLRQEMSLLVNNCRNVAEARAVFGRISGVAKQFLDVDLADAGHVFHDEAVPLSVRRRVPLCLGEPRSPASLCIAKLAQRLDRTTQVPPENRGFFGRLTGVWRKSA
jgi:flagellar biosynthesis protein FlhG